MDLSQLGRVDVFKVSATANNCMKLFPLGKNPTRKVCVGDFDGVVRGFSVKKGAVRPVFKTLPHSRKIMAVDLSGDKAFFAFGDTIKGINKKGKEFYQMRSHLTEVVKTMAVNVPICWISGEYVIYRYREDREVGFYMCPDRINCITTQRVGADSEDAILGCRDRMLRVVKESDCNLEIVVGNAVSAVSRYNRPGEGGAGAEPTRCVLYGTETGRLGMLELDSANARLRWSIDGKRNIRTISSCDFTHDGLSDILVGRADGTVEVYSFDLRPNGKPSRVFERNVNDGITSIHGGYITNGSNPDVLCSTYSGKIIAFCRDSARMSNRSGLGVLDNLKVDKRIKKVSTAAKQAINLIRSITEGNDYRASRSLRFDASKRVVGVDKRYKIQAIRKDIQKLEELVREEKIKFARMSKDMIAVTTRYNCKYACVLDAARACYRLSFDLDIPIDHIALYCNAPIDIISAETSGVIVSYGPPEPGQGSSTVKAVFRCSETTNRVEILLRTVEGAHGGMEAYVLPRLVPKSAHCEFISIKPLSLHERRHALESDNRVMNTLTITGDFSLAQVHGWICQCFENVPEKFYDDELRYVFRSTFRSTIVDLKIKAGEAIVRSDNISSLSIMEEFITKRATERKGRISSSVRADDSTYESVLKLIYPKIEYRLGLSRKMKLIESLKEIRMREENVDFLSEEYRDILDSERRIAHGMTRRTRRLEFLYNIIMRLLADRCKYRRESANEKLKELKRVLKSGRFTLRSLVRRFFKRK